jgi:hypothetical protein
LSTFHTHFTISLTQFPCAFSQPYHPFHHIWNKKNQRQEKQSFLIQSTPPPPGLTPFNPIQFMDNVLQHCYEQISYRLWGRRWIWSISHLGIWFWSQNWFFLCWNKKGVYEIQFWRGLRFQKEEESWGWILGRYLNLGKKFMLIYYRNTSYLFLNFGKS